MSMQPFVVDAEIVDEHTRTATGPRARLRQASARVSAVDKRAAMQAARADMTLIADGVRGRKLAAYERERMAEYRYNGNPDADVREDLRTYHEKEKDRRARQADDDDMSIGEAVRYAKLGALVVGELLFVAWLIGGLSGWYAALGLLVCVANVIAAPVVWRRLRREGDTYRAKIAAWQMGQDPSDEPELDHSAASLTSVFADAGIVRSADSGGSGVALEEPVSSDERSFTARLALPRGVTVGKVRTKTKPLASALDVYPQHIQVGSGGSERRLVLRVFRELPFTGTPVRSPLVGSRGHSLSAGVPVGTDIDGAPVTVDLAKGRHGLVVASSGNGKTVLLQSVASATVLDVSGQLTLLDGKPDGAYTEYEPYCTGVVTTADEDYLERAAQLLEWVCEDMEHRLARAKRGEDIGGDHVVILDEFQEFTGNLSGGGMRQGEAKPRIREALDRIARRGRSAGVRLVLASQDFDGRNLDDPVLTNIGWRAVGYAPSAMSREALGDLADRLGLDTSLMFVDEVQAGAMVIAGGGVHPYRAMRSYLQTPADIRAVCATAGTLRPAGTPAAAGPHSTDAETPSDQHDSGSEREAASTAAANTLDEDTAALLRAILEVYADDDAEWIPTTTLVAEVAVGELGRTHDRTTEMHVSETLLQAGASKKRTYAGGENKPMSWHRPTLIQAARTALGE